MANNKKVKLGNKSIKIIRKCINLGFGEVLSLNSKSQSNNMIGALWFAVCVTVKGPKLACEIFDIKSKCEESLEYYNSKMFISRSRSMVESMMQIPLHEEGMDARDAIDCTMGLEHIDWDNKYLVKIRKSFDPNNPPEFTKTTEMREESVRALKLWGVVVNKMAKMIARKSNGLDVADLEKCLWHNIKLASTTGDEKLVAMIAGHAKAAMEEAPGCLSVEDFTNMNPTSILWTEEDDARFLHKDDDEFFTAALKLAGSDPNIRIGTYDTLSQKIEGFVGEEVAQA